MYVESNQRQFPGQKTPFAPRKGIAGEWKNRDIVVPVAESEALNAKAKIVANTMERQLRLDEFFRRVDGDSGHFLQFHQHFGIPQNSWTVCLQMFTMDDLGVLLL